MSDTKPDKFSDLDLCRFRLAEEQGKTIKLQIALLNQQAAELQREGQSLQLELTQRYALSERDTVNASTGIISRAAAAPAPAAAASAAVKSSNGARKAEARS